MKADLIGACAVLGITWGIASAVFWVSWRRHRAYTRSLGSVLVTEVEKFLSEQNTFGGWQ